MAYTKYSLTPADNNAAPPNGAPEGMLPSAVNDTMRDMMSQIRDVGDGIRGGTYTMTAPVITGGSITGVALSGNTLTNPVITGGSINNTTVGATTRSTGAFTTLASNGATTFTAGTASTSTTTGTAVITGGLGVSGRINAANFDGIVGANTAAAGNFTTLGATGVATFSAGTVSAPAITTTGDTNTGIYFPAADTIAFTEGGVESMRIDSSGNLGIGTTTSTNRMTVQFSNTATTANSDSGITILNSARGNNYQATVKFGSYESNNTTRWTGAEIGGTFTTYADGANNAAMVFSTSNSGTLAERMRINNSGNLFLGTTSATIAGDRVFEAKSSGTTRIESISTGQYAVYNLGSGASGTATAGYLLTDSTANTMVLAASTNTPMLFSTNNTERMRIDAGGNLLINTSTATNNLRLGAKLAIVGNGTSTYAGMGISSYSGGSAAVASFLDFNRSGGATDGTMTAVANGNTLGYIVFRGADGTSFANSSQISAEVDGTVSSTAMPGRILFSTSAAGSNSPAERMRIDSSGNVLVAKTSSNLNTVGCELLPIGVVQFTRNAASGYVGYWNIQGGSGGIQEFYLANVSKGSISVAAGGTTYATTSDYRLKENIAPMTGALATVATLKPVTYKWKADGSNGQGFIAHELQAVVPDCVTGEKDAVGEDGKPRYQGIDTSFLVATLTAAIQELKAEFDAYKATHP